MKHCRCTSTVLYLVATLIEHVRVNRHGVGGATVPLLAIPPHRACSQDVLLLGPPDRYRVLGALAILMPHLGDGLGLLLRCNLGLIIQAFRVVRRPHLKGDDGAPLSDVMMHVGERSSAACLHSNSEMKSAWVLQREEPGWCGS